MSARPFAAIYEQVVRRFAGDEAALRARLPDALSADVLRSREDARYLSDMARRVFRAGLRHSVVDARWPAFERAFHNFEPAWVAAMSDDALDALMADRSLIRHWAKLKSVRSNAQMLQAIRREAGSVGAWLAGWPSSRVVELWWYLQKHGAQLGGLSAAHFLRMAGKDTFLLTGDVVAALRGQALVDREPRGRREQARIQGVFNQWAGESGWPLCRISRLLSMTANY
ncbi:MAG TPA: DNA-3-methyladenine glycosylase I [Spongiibacteraceae bacterium]|nr:DNA-3-methyladenine glycosylase I [Spongiibacteraceae bacterium]